MLVYSEPRWLRVPMGSSKFIIASWMNEILVFHSLRFYNLTGHVFSWIFFLKFRKMHGGRYRLVSITGYSRVFHFDVLFWKLLSSSGGNTTLDWCVEILAVQVYKKLVCVNISYFGQNNYIIFFEVMTFSPYYIGVFWRAKVSGSISMANMNGFLQK